MIKIMKEHHGIKVRGLYLLAGPLLLLALQPTILSAQAAPPKAPQPPAPSTPMTDQELQTTQEQLLQLLRTSPTLTTVVAHDPSLLSNQEYVNKNNPQLGQFLIQHPDVARNPEYYLFTNLNFPGGRRSQALERAVWPEMSAAPYQPNHVRDAIEPLAALAAFACFLATLAWLIRQFLENRRWSRIFKLQSDVHARLIEKFASTQEIGAYMDTEAGKRFLEAAPIPIELEQDQRMPNVVARVLNPLQIGVVLVLLGVGFFLLRNIHSDMRIPMLVLGTVALMPGIGFILSAGITWVLAGRLGMIPDSVSAAELMATAKQQDRH
jgi:hypothetical protein